MLDHFRAQGAHRVRTLVDERMPEIEKFFRSLGFQPAPVKALALELDPGDAATPSPAAGC